MSIREHDPDAEAGRAPTALVVMAADVFRNQFGAAQLARLRRIADVPDPLAVDDLDDPALDARLADVEVLLTGWGAPALDAARLARMPRLGAMLHCAGSIRPQVTESFWDRGIRASSVAEVNAIPVAEFAFAAIVLAGKNAPFLAADPMNRRFEGGADRYGPLGNRDRTVGVVGFSRIGRRVVEMLQQLEGIRVLVADPLAAAEEVAAAGGELVALDTLIPAVDVLSLHAPALPSTRHMIDRPRLAALEDHVTVINTARGSLIDHDALTAECVAGRLNAILDVTDPEPLPADSPLYALPNVMITPHVAGSLGSELTRMTDAALDELERLAGGLPLQHEVTRDDLRTQA